MNLRNLKVETIKDKLHRVLWNSYYNHIKDNKVDINLVFKDVVERFISIPATVECEECKGKGYKKSHLVKTEIGNFFLYTCPSCTDGQRPLMKVRKCPNCYDELFNTFMGADDCEECLNGKITSPLTLADIDWGKSKLKLKEGWEVEE